MTKPSPAIEAACLSDLGQVRQNNEDAWFCDPDGRLFLVADGMGGHAGGEVASSLVAETIAAAAPAAAAWESPERELPALLAQANARVLERARGPLSGMGATAVLLFIQGKRGWVCHAGDSRAYRWREGALAQLTVDHTPENELGLDAYGRHLDLPDVRRASPQRRRSGMITRAVGIGPDLESDTRAVDVRPGDRFLLCSDGLTDLVSPARIADLLSAAAAPAGACRALVEAALAAGGLDNVTVMVIHSA